MNVLTVISSLELGGIEKTLLKCLPYFEKEDVSISICCYSKKGVLKEEFEERSSGIFYIKKSIIPFYEAFQIYTLVRQNKIDVVHSRFGFTSGIFALFFWVFRIPFFVSIHSQRSFFLQNKPNIPFRGIIRFIYLGIHKWLTIFFSKKIIGHSYSNLNAFYKRWKTWKKDKFIMIYNGIEFGDLEENDSLPLSLMEFLNDSVKTFIHVGNFRIPKNHKYLISAFKLLGPIENRYKLILIGGGGNKSEIEGLVEKEGLNDAVYFVGTDTKIGKYLKISNVFLFPSLDEGLGNVLLEAQYMNLPICASDIPPHYESTFDYYHKFFFDPKNELDARDKIKKLILESDLDKQKETLNKAKMFAINNFSIQTMAGKLAEVYHKSYKG
ncbi:glycosyltransferase family 4 protein [Pedobacter antarcticus]|uniref:glycosyltransferase family 4 protein n=1 Tax=Pedobacter antarcticus TaxID=34086 RepID=UPI00292FDD1C|nr:glycosyltransferase family 4 protein [Pedobacter antarcticus]